MRTYIHRIADFDPKNRIGHGYMPRRCSWLCMAASKTAAVACGLLHPSERPAASPALMVSAYTVYPARHSCGLQSRCSNVEVAAWEVEYAGHTGVSRGWKALLMNMNMKSPRLEHDLPARGVCWSTATCRVPLPRECFRFECTCSSYSLAELCVERNWPFVGLVFHAQVLVLFRPTAL